MAADVTTEEWNRAWQSTLDGRYVEAGKLWDNIVARYPRRGIPNLNRGITRLLLGDLCGALDDFQQQRSHPPGPVRYSGEYVGVTLWLLGEHEAACEDWADDIAKRRSGAIAASIEVASLLWWAAAYPDHEQWRKLARDELRRRWRARYVRASFESPIIPFLLGSNTESELLAAVAARLGQGALYPRLSAKANFYIGARALDAGDHKRYKAQLALTTGLGRESILDPETHLARGELQGLEQRTG
jgi:hypothetical protein